MMPARHGHAAEERLGRSEDLLRRLHEGGDEADLVAALPGRSGPAVRRPAATVVVSSFGGESTKSGSAGVKRAPRLYYRVMPKATVETVDHVARLARLYLTDAERQLFARQLADILAYAESIQALDTAAVEPMSHALTAGSLPRGRGARGPAAAKPCSQAAPDAKDGLFRVPRVLGG